MKIQCEVSQLGERYHLPSAHALSVFSLLDLKAVVLLLLQLLHLVDLHKEGSQKNDCGQGVRVPRA